MTKIKEFIHRLRERVTDLGKVGTTVMVISSIVILVLIAFGINQLINRETPDPLPQISNETSISESAASTEVVASIPEPTETQETLDIDESKISPELDLPAEGPISLLSGLPIDQEAFERRPIGVMISNIKEALPQYGISQAEVLYETIVEGGITRLFALFQDFSAEKIGPIRSSRHYFLDFALDHDAIYTHVGQSTYATKAFKELDVDRFYGISSIEGLFVFYDPDRVRPHSSFTGKEELLSVWAHQEYRTELKEMTNKFDFSKEDTDLTDGTNLSSITLDYSYYIKPSFVYDPTTKEYYRFQFDQEHLDATTNEQLHFKNLIIQYTSIWQIKNDPYGCMDMNLIGEGEGLYITNGKSVPIRWEKADHYTATRYYLLDGSGLVINPGKTFISVFPENRVDKIMIEE